MQSKVASLADQRTKAKWKELQRSLDPENLFDIPMGEIDQFLDGANDSKSDPIILHGKAPVAVKRLLSHFGIDSTPTTVGEFRGALFYCKIIQGFSFNIPATPMHEALWDKNLYETIEEMMPELLESIRAFKRGDLEAMREIHRTRLTLEVMSSYYHPEHGWLSRGKAD